MRKEQWSMSGVLDSRWIRVCSLADLTPLWGEAALIDQRQVAIFRLPDDRLFAVNHQDPDTGAMVMARGIIGSHQEAVTLASPLHKQVYNLLTGQCYTDPKWQLQVWDICLHDGEIYIAEKA